jgi:hypothetical protein
MPNRNIVTIAADLKQGGSQQEQEKGVSVASGSPNS